MDNTASHDDILEYSWLGSRNFDLLQEVLDVLSDNVLSSIDDKEYLISVHKNVIDSWKFFLKVVYKYASDVYPEDYVQHLENKGNIKLRQFASIFRERCGLSDIYPESVYPKIDVEDLEYKMDEYLSGKGCEVVISFK